MRRIRKIWIAAWILLWLVSSPIEPPPSCWAAPSSYGERSYEVLDVYLNIDQALVQMFPQADRFEQADVRLTDVQLDAVSKAAGYRVQDRAYSTYKAYRSGRSEGYAVVSEEVGKFHLITYAVAVTPQGKVKQVEVLVYRESRGGEIRHRRFLQQYVGKSIQDPIRLNRDILNVTGATLSVRAMNRGVRKALEIIRLIYPSSA